MAKDIDNIVFIAMMHLLKIEPKIPRQERRRKFREEPNMARNKMLAHLTETLLVTVDYSLSVAQGIQAGHYDYIDEAIAAWKPHITRPDQPLLEAILVEFDEGTNLKDALVDLDTMGLWTGGFFELLALGAQHPDKQREYSITALGDPHWKDPVPRHWKDAEGFFSGGWVGGKIFFPYLGYSSDKPWLRGRGREILLSYWSYGMYGVRVLVFSKESKGSVAERFPTMILKPLSAEFRKRRKGQKKRPEISMGGYTVIQRGWKVVEDTPLEGTPRLSLAGFLEGEEKFVLGETMLQRGKSVTEQPCALGGYDHLEAMIDHTEDIPDEWEGRNLVGAGTVWQDRDGERWVAYITPWGGNVKGWDPYLKFRRLSDVWYNARLICVLPH